MDPHPTPFRVKRRSVAAPAKTAVPKPKSVATARGKMAKKSPTTSNAVSAGAAPQPRPRRAFGTVRNSNSLAEKPPLPPLQKPAKLSPPPLQKPLKVSPRPLQKPSKLSPPNPIRATRPYRPAAKPLKNACPGPDLEPKAKKKGQRVSFQEDAVAVAAPGNGDKVKASIEDPAGHTPMLSAKALEKKPMKVVAAETPFFSAQNCSSCTLDQLESASYWLAQIHLAESVGKHSVSAAFFRLAFECQALPFHRIQNELRNYVVRHESASTFTTLFDELLLAHGTPVNQPKFDTDGFEEDTTLVHECSGCDCGGDLVDVGEVNIVKQGEEGTDQPSFERKLDESFEFDDCEAVIVDRLVEAHSVLGENVSVKIPCDSEIIQSVCNSSFDKLSFKGSPEERGSSERRLSSESHLDKLSPSPRSLSAKRLSSGSPFDKESPCGSGPLKRLTSSCPSYKSATRSLPSKRTSSSDGDHNATAGAGDSSKVIQEGAFDCHALVDQFELKEHGEHAAINEIH